MARRIATLVVVVACAAACGGGGSGAGGGGATEWDAPEVEPCSLLTESEVGDVLGGFPYELPFTEDDGSEGCDWVLDDFASATLTLRTFRSSGDALDEYERATQDIGLLPTENVGDFGYYGVGGVVIYQGRSELTAEVVGGSDDEADALELAKIAVERLATN